MTVMRLVVSGLLNKQVADELGITESTVKAQRDVVMQKMKAKARNVPFWVLDGSEGSSLTFLKRMAGTTRLELATSAVTVAGYNYFQRHGRARTAL